MAKPLFILFEVRPDITGNIQTNIISADVHGPGSPLFDPALSHEIQMLDEWMVQIGGENSMAKELTQQANPKRSEEE